MVDILANERDLNALVDRHNHLGVGGGGTKDLNLLRRIGELPLPLIADHLNLDRYVLWLARINNVEHTG